MNDRSAPTATNLASHSDLATLAASLRNHLPAELAPILDELDSALLERAKLSIEFEAASPRANAARGLKIGKVAVADPDDLYSLDETAHLTAAQEFILFSDLRVFVLKRQILLLDSPSATELVMELNGQPSSASKAPTERIAAEKQMLEKLLGLIEQVPTLRQQYTSFRTFHDEFLRRKNAFWPKEQASLFERRHYDLLEEGLPEELRPKHDALAKEIETKAVAISRHYVNLTYFSLQIARIGNKHPLREDLEQSTYLHLIKIIPQFESEQGFRFSTFAATALARDARREARMIAPGRRQSKLDYSMGLVHEQVVQKTGSAKPGLHEIIEHAGTSPNEAQRIIKQLDHLPPRRTFYLPDMSHDEDRQWEPADLETPSSPTIVMEEQETKERVTLCIEHFGKKNQRLAQVLALRFGLDGQGARYLHEIGAAFNVTHERARQLILKALAKLRTYWDIQILAKDRLPSEEAAAINHLDVTVPRLRGDRDKNSAALLSAPFIKKPKTAADRVREYLESIVEATTPGQAVPTHKMIANHIGTSIGNVYAAMDKASAATIKKFDQLTKDYRLAVQAEKARKRLAETAPALVARVKAAPSPGHQSNSAKARLYIASLLAESDPKKKLPTLAQVAVDLRLNYKTVHYAFSSLPPKLKADYRERVQPARIETKAATPNPIRPDLEFKTSANLSAAEAWMHTADVELITIAMLDHLYSIRDCALCWYHWFAGLSVDEAAQKTSTPISNACSILRRAVRYIEKNRPELMARLSPQKNDADLGQKYGPLNYNKVSSFLTELRDLSATPNDAI